MVRWRHNVPALERERLARRGPDGGRPAGRGLAQPAAALATAPVDGVAAAPDPGAVADRRCGRLERPEDREGRPAALRPHSVGSVYMRAYRLDLHGQPRPDDDEENPRGPPGPAPPNRVFRMESRSTTTSGGPAAALVRGSSGPCSQSARDASASCLRWRRRDSRVTAARSGEVRGAQWSEMDTKTDVWTVPTAPMKTLCAHRVPLCGRSIEIRDAARTLGTVRWCSPAAGEGSSTHPRPWPMASGRRSGTGRPRRRTNPREVIEAALAHVVGNKVEAAYARSDMFEQRGASWTDWEAYLAGERPPGKGTNACGAAAGPLRRAAC